MIPAIVILAIVVIVLAAIIYMLLSRLSAQQTLILIKDNDAEDLRRSLSAEQASRQVVEARLEETNTYHARELAAIEKAQHEAQTKSNDAFKILAAEILKDSTASLMKQNQSQVSQLLSPLKDDIERFRKQVTDCYTAESRERFSLQQRIKELVNASDNIGKEAKELATALRGNSKTQGDWGEFILESILEQSGLKEGVQFFPQLTSDDGVTTLRDATGRGLRPDVVVRYPGNRSLVIDSKVSLTAYVNYANAETDTEREASLKAHVASVARHVAELADKKYQDYIGDQKLDFVMMFIPNEAAYAAAITADNNLWQKAFDKRVLLVSPVQLVASLRIVKQIWNQDSQTRNAIEIAERSGQLYDKFVAFIEDMEKIGKTIESTRSAYNAAMNKLKDGRGNMVKRAEDLRSLGIKATKRLNKELVNQSDVFAADDEK